MYQQDSKKRDKVLVIVGPTSSGKTTLALTLAKHIDGSIISADSRQIYFGMDLGTGKLPIKSTYSIQKAKNRWTLDEIDIWGYDLVNPNEYYSAYDYAKFALIKLRELEKAGKTTFIVGGTGFYADILTGRSKPANIKPDLDLRKHLEKEGLDNLRKKLMSLNPDVMDTIDINNPVRLIRAIEIELGEPDERSPLPYYNGEFMFVGLHAHNEYLYNRADVWLEETWNSGLITEVEGLVRSGYGDSPKLHGLIYKSVLEYMNSVVSEEEAKERAKYDTHAYIRRQLTWFRRNKDINWFDISKIGNQELAQIILDKYLA